MLHGIKMGAGVLQQGTEDEGKTDAQVDIYGLDETVGIGKGSAGTHHQSRHRQNSGHT